MPSREESRSQILGLYIYNFEKPLSVGVDLGTSAIKIIRPPTEEGLRMLSSCGEAPEEKPHPSLQHLLQ
ncbi:MAG: hypothetical protein QXE22_06885 [Candidatus Bathyarchaeia archaeon]